MTDDVFDQTVNSPAWRSHKPKRFEDLATIGSYGDS